MPKMKFITLNLFQFIPAVNNAIKYNSMINHTFPETGLSVLVSCEIDSIKLKTGRIGGTYETRLNSNTKFLRIILK